jgi:hypothetical protein
LTSTRSRLASNWRATGGRAFLAKLSKERQSPDTFEGRAANSVLVQHDAPRREERGRQLVLRHPVSGRRITDVVSCRFAALASDLQQSAMISSVEYPKLRNTLQLLSGARFQAAADSANIPASSCGAELSSVARTLRKGSCGFDLDILDLSCSLDKDGIRHRGAAAAG